MEALAEIISDFFNMGYSGIVPHEGTGNQLSRNA
jgi:hypothetical protein